MGPAMTEPRTWCEFEPNQWAGSLATIRRGEAAILQIYRDSAAQAGSYWLDATTELFRLGCPAHQIAGFMTERLLEYAETAQIERFGPVTFDEEVAAQRLFRTVYGAVKANTEEIYSFAAQRLTAILYYS